jgi:hypothetical protein
VAKAVPREGNAELPSCHNHVIWSW